MNLDPPLPVRKRARRNLCVSLWFACAIGTPISLHADGNEIPGGVAGIAAHQVQMRQKQVEAAQTLFTAGSRAYADRSYGEAMDNFKAAFEAMPPVPAVAEQRIIFFRRYQASAFRFAEIKAEEGRWAEAEQTLEEIVGMAEDHSLPGSVVDPGVRKMLKELKEYDDRYNRAVSPRHLANVERVEAKLILARGYVELGDYDRAERAFNEVLAVDPYNSAARRGLEENERYRLNYYDQAYNHTRAKAISGVLAGWETPVPTIIDDSDVIGVLPEVATGGNVAIEQKLKNIIIPRIEFNDARLVDVAEYLIQKSLELDTSETDPSKRGVNIVIDSSGSGANLAQQPLSVRLSNIPLGEAIRYVAQQVDMRYRIDAFAVTIVPLSADATAALSTRRYTVPPGFLSASGAGGAAAAVAADPFAEPAAANTGISVNRITAQEYLEQNGVVFGEGATAQYIAASSTLVVRNTADQLETVDLLVRAAKESGEKQLKIGIKMITVENQNLKEMGLDFLLGPSNIGGGTPRVFAAGGTDGNSSNPVGGTFFPFTNPATGLPVGLNPVTSGLRSGDLSNSQTIEDILNRDNPSAGGARAPGVFSIAGVFTDPQFQVLIRALSQTKGVDVLNDIHVVSKPGQIAKIEQVREFIYPTEYDPPELPNTVGIVEINGVRIASDDPEFPATPATPTAFETRNLGAVIEVEPTVGADNLTIGLNITADFSDFVGFINYGTPIRNTRLLTGLDNTPLTVTENRILMPVFDAVKETTSVTIWDGQTVAIGGLHGESITSSEDKIPYAGDLPVIGRAFRTKTNDSTKQAIVIFVTAELIDPGGNLINAPEDEPELITRQDVPPLRNFPQSGPPPAGVYPAK